MSEFDWVKNMQGGGGQRAPDDFNINIDPERMFKLFWLVVLVLVLLWGGSSAYYTVEANEEAVVLRLGKIHNVYGPGFHGKLPFGIDKVHKRAVKTVHSAEFGYRTLSAGVKSQFDYNSPGVVAEASMLTGDLNLVMITWEVRYKINKLKDYLFEVRDPEQTLRDVSEAVMRIEIGDRSVDEALTLDRPAIENAVKEKMQQGLDALKCGIQIVKINLGRASPPDAVRDAFSGVNRAMQVRARIVNEAEGERNRKIPAARGAADRVVKEAEGYKIGRVNRAEGETDAFLAVLSEYRKAEDITRRRLYLEAMEESLPKVGDIMLIDDKDNGVLKLLDLKNGGAK